MNEQAEQLYLEIDNLLYRYSQEFDLKFADVSFVLMLLLHRTMVTANTEEVDDDDGIED